jgi:hypothetical protein
MNFMFSSREDMFFGVPLGVAMVGLTLKLG